MVGGVLWSLFYYLTRKIAALEAGDDRLVIIGLLYGADVETGFETSTAYGFTIGKAITTAADRSFTPLWTVSETVVSAVVDYNLAKNGRTYTGTSSSTPVVGGYHIQLEKTWSTAESLLTSISYIENECINGSGYYCIPSYIDGSYRLRIGDFASYAQASAALATLPNLTGNYYTGIASPTSTAVTLLNPYTDKILFEYDCGTSSFLGLEPIQQSGAEEAYTKTPAGNLYQGVFIYSHYISGTTDGIQVTNLLELEKYITGVLPYEISASWNFETQKVFAISVRTYAIRNLGRHYSAYGFDLCNNTNCQVYRGINRVNENVRAAVETTRAQVLAYNSALASIYYHATSGGETITPTAAWGGSAPPYLASIKTPWEQYTDYSKGYWQVVIPAAELRTYLYGRGYTKLTGSYIESITINETAGNTGYVTSLTVRDNLGNTVTKTTADGVRDMLTGYLPSSNFIVGKGSVTYSYEVVTNIEVTLGTDNATVSGEEYPTLFDRLRLDGVTAQTALGKLSGSSSQVIAVTSSGRRAITGESFAVLSASGYNNLQQMIANGTIPASSITVTVTDLSGFTGITTNDININVSTKTITDTKYAGSSGSFVFAGKGYGHGVGISQNGANNLANAGVTCDLILETYFPGTDVVDMHTLGY